MLTQILFAVVMMFSAVATMFSAVAAAAPDPAAPVLYVYSVGSIAKTTVILDGQELAKIKGVPDFWRQDNPGGNISSNYAAQTRRRNRLSSTSPIRISISAWANILATSGSLPARLQARSTSRAELGTSWMLRSSAQKLGRKLPKNAGNQRFRHSQPGYRYRTRQVTAMWCRLPRCRLRFSTRGSYMPRFDPEVESKCGDERP